MGERDNHRPSPPLFIEFLRQHKDPSNPPLTPTAIEAGRRVLMTLQPGLEPKANQEITVPNQLAGGIEMFLWTEPTLVGSREGLQSICSTPLSIRPEENLAGISDGWLHSNRETEVPAYLKSLDSFWLINLVITGCFAKHLWDVSRWPARISQGPLWLDFVVWNCCVSDRS